jgi:hypothetical protein
MNLTTMKAPPSELAALHSASACSNYPNGLAGTYKAYSSALDCRLSIAYG